MEYLMMFYRLEIICPFLFYVLTADDIISGLKIINANESFGDRSSTYIRINSQMDLTDSSNSAISSVDIKKFDEPQFSFTCSGFDALGIGKTLLYFE